jgi:hypothetical protein
MRWRTAIGVVFGVVGAAACGGGSGDGGGNGNPPPPPPIGCENPLFADGFEGGLGAWQGDFDLPQDPNDPGDVVDWSITQSGEQAFEGSFSARYFLDGRQDDGTIWLVRALDVAPNADVLVHLQFQLWSESESFNTLAAVVAYAGVDPPQQEADFDLTRRANDVTGWAPYEYAFPVRTDATGRIHVALGISAVWEAEMVYFLDDVRVCVD